MNRTDAPAKQATPFGVNGQREPILATTPAGDNTASYEQGFPPVTMILKSAGGLPPKGQDMNQILYELSSLCRWMSSGALNSFDPSFSSSIGGYPKASVVVGDNGATIFISQVDGNTNNPNSNQSGWLNLSKVTSIANLPGGSNKLPYFTSTTDAGQTDLTSVGRDIIGKNSIQAVIDYLGLNLGIPMIGAPFFWPNTQMPSDVFPTLSGLTFLKMNGASFSATEYPYLAAAFPGLVLPDFRGEFIRLWDDGRGVDSGRNLLTAQSFAMQNITGTLGEFTDTSGQYAVDINAATGVFQTSIYLRNVMSPSTFVQRNAAVLSTFDASRQVQTADETRPRNVSIGFIVRAK